MRSLPQKAQAFVWITYALGLAAWLGASWYAKNHPALVGYDLLIFFLLGLVAGSHKVRLMPKRTSSQADLGSLSLSFVLTFAAVIRYGPGIGVVVGATTALSACLFPQRQPFYQLCFNVLLNSIATFVSGMVFFLLSNLPFLGDSGPLVAVSLASLAFYFINTGFVAIILGLVLRQAPKQVWYTNFLWTAPSYFLGAAVGFAASLIESGYVLWGLICGVPIAFLTYKSYRLYFEHVEETIESRETLSNLYLATVQSLALAIDAKDAYTHQHILRVQRYAVATAEALGMQGDDLEGVNTGALLHDIGKLGVPEYVLLKPGKLTEEEFAKIREYPRIGADILAGIPFPWPVLPVVKYHHERWDGSGYPDGLKGEQIPLGARILAVADVYDALTSARAYRSAWSHERAVGLLQEEAGKQFDPAVVAAFLRVIGPIATQLTVPVATSPTAVPVAHDTQRAVQAIQRNSSELWALYEVAQTLSTSLGLNDTLDILARKLEAIIPNVACVFLLHDPEDHRLHVRAAVGLNREFFLEARSVGQGTCSMRAVHTQEPYCGAYEPEDLLLVSQPEQAWVTLNSSLIVPIIHQGAVLGTINLYHPDRDAFGEHDLQLLARIGERAALALYNGMLFERTQSHAHTDTLTGLYNLRYVVQNVEQRCQHTLTRDEKRMRHDDGFALLCLDLDSFKPINDLYGHQTGDRVLTELGNLLRNLVRPTDIVARYGGDEFVILLEGAGALEATVLAGRIQETIRDFNTNLVHPKLGPLRIGVSVGYSCFPKEGADWSSLLSVADQRMYNNKAERKLGRLVDSVP